jgi:hypothetical protein
MCRSTTHRPRPLRLSLLIPPTAATDGCHAGKDTMLEAAKQAGQSEMLDQFAKDYPSVRTISRNPCVRRSDLCGLVCG